MPSPDSESPDEGFFNNLSQRVPDTSHVDGQEPQNDGSAKMKRIACVLCRKRKLRCDGARPECSTCKRLNHDCAYDEVRKKSGPKRGYVKLLEQRLQQVETLLKTQDAPEHSREAPRSDTASAYVASTIQQSLSSAADFLNTPDGGQTGSQSQPIPAAVPFQQTGTSSNGGEAEMSWEMIGLGLEEPLPPQDVQDELYQIYFSKIHPSVPMVHRPRFMAALNLAPQMRPPICLRYIMWTLAASVADKYEALAEHFYQRARKYAQLDEMKGHGESTITLSHCQTWVLTCTYEFKQMYFPRAWLSAGRAVRLAQMMQLHRLDGAGLDVKQCLFPPKDWTEREERRRTFWLAFAIDRYASIGTGWPMIIDERDVLTNLPASEEAFEKSRPMATGSLDQVLSSNGADNLQAMGAIALTAAMFGRNLLHLHRPGPNDGDDDINGSFWNRHREIEQILLQTSLGLPDHLRLPSNLASPNVVFANMCIHTSAICLHQAAIFKADKYRLPTSVSNESKIRCVTAAAEIASIMRMISHMDLAAMNPFISFCVYVAARVFVQYLKTRPKDQQMISSLQFLLQAMHALRRKNPLTESFLVQLDLDLESAGIQGLQQKAFVLQTSKVPTHDQWQCSTPIVDPKETQSNTASPLETIRSVSNDQIPTSRYASTAPAPPYQIHPSNSIDMNNQNNGFMRSQIPTSSGTQLPQFGASTFTFVDGEMDTTNDRNTDHPSPATISSQSRGGSTSQSSYSPGGPQTNIPYRASPKMAPGNIGMSSGNPASAIGDATMFAGFDATTNDLFSNSFATSGGLNEAAFQQGFLVDNEWEFTAMNAGTGMTPMADGSWDSMLESVTMGWDGMGPLRDAGGRG
ncbi:C6 transcription factor-like protein Prf [Plenodomus tracheiphilus IPT5]|uniref:C6 transcription factor-like protein Prf n=1 Tax=Plenodomus tracheiphilus IPT5 TaxID=1408161 RepID=A0A6A7BMD0_9PLEO|nr:C6 transcription factor-like protein Prf [Plenodomus tracheiphilus IPT5]